MSGDGQPARAFQDDAISGSASRTVLPFVPHSVSAVDADPLRPNYRRLHEQSDQGCVPYPRAGSGPDRVDQLGHRARCRPRAAARHAHYRSGCRHRAAGSTAVARPRSFLVHPIERRLRAACPFFRRARFVVIQPTHANPRLAGLDAALPGGSLFWRSRVDDLIAIAHRLAEIEASCPTIAGRIDRGKLVAVGHPLGAQSVGMLLGPRPCRPGLAARLCGARGPRGPPCKRRMQMMYDSGARRSRLHTAPAGRFSRRPGQRQDHHRDHRHLRLFRRGRATGSRTWSE